MRIFFAQKLEKYLGKFVSYQKLVEISNILNFPLVHPIVASVSITSHCNSKCVYCPIWKFGEGLPDISIDKLDKLFNSLEKIGIKIITFTGGEPLVRPDLEEIISLAKYYGMIVEVCTNGILLTKKRAFKLVKSGVDNIILSLDSLDPEIYEMHRGVPFYFGKQALTSLLYIKNEFPALSCMITCIVTQKNIGTLVPFIDQIHDYGKAKILVNLQPYHQFPSYSLDFLDNLSPKMSNRMESNQEELFENEQELIPSHELRNVFEKEINQLINLKRNMVDYPLNNSEFFLKCMPDYLFDQKLPGGLNCVSGFMQIVIRSNLEIAPCWRLQPIGDLNIEDLNKIWFSQKFSEKRKQMKKLKCSGCMLLCHMEPGSYEWYNEIYKLRINRLEGLGADGINR